MILILLSLLFDFFLQYKRKSITPISEKISENISIISKASENIPKLFRNKYHFLKNFRNSNSHKTIIFILIFCNMDISVEEFPIYFIPKEEHTDYEYMWDQNSPERCNLNKLKKPIYVYQPNVQPNVK